MKFSDIVYYISMIVGFLLLSHSGISGYGYAAIATLYIGLVMSFDLKIKGK